MQKTTSTTCRHVVRYPRATLIAPAIVLAISAVGLHMAIAGKGHWTLWHVAGWATVGTLFLLNQMMYRTAFFTEAVEQRTFPGFLRRLRYADIVRVHWKWAGMGRMLLLFSNDRKPMKIYGSTAQLIEARNVLFEQVPQAFDNRD